MNAQNLAALLDGLDYGEEDFYARVEYFHGEAKANCLVIVYGDSDDLIEFRGAIRDEAGCFEGGTILFDAKGVLPSWDSASESEESAKDYFERKAKAKTIEALWANEPGYSWTYKTDIPHETFEIVEDGEPYCRGVVFALADLNSDEDEE